MKILLFIILCSFSFHSNAQQSAVIKGVLKDKLDGKPIPNAVVSILLDSITYSAITQQRGFFILECPKSAKYSIKVEHELYNDYEETIFSAEKKDTSEISISMTRAKFLDTFTLIAPGVPKKVFGDSILSVADFEVLKDGRIVLLTYPKRLDKGSELLLWDQNSIVSRKKVEGLAEELVRDYRGNAHVICKEKVFGVHVAENDFSLSVLEKEYFKKYLSPILDTNKSILFFSNFNKDYPSFNYYSYDQLDSTYTKIIEITDDLMMELYRSEYKWVDVRTKLWAKNQELKTGIDAEIWVGANYFTQSVYYKQLYAPMFHRNDTLFVFDYYKDQLRRFNQKGELIDSIAIYHHYHPKDSGWKKNLIQDQVTGQIFAVMELAGYSYIRHLDTETGKLGDKIQLEFRYAEKIEINDNSVYYIYRPFESVQKKFLYKEKLPFNFEQGRVPAGDHIKSN